MNIDLINKTLKRHMKAQGVNPLPADRVFPSVVSQHKFMNEVVKMQRENIELQDACDIAATAMQAMRDRIQDLEAVIADAGRSSMEVGDPRKP